MKPVMKMVNASELRVGDLLEIPVDLQRVVKISGKRVVKTEWSYTFHEWDVLLKSGSKTLVTDDQLWPVWRYQENNRFQLINQSENSAKKSQRVKGRDICEGDLFQDENGCWRRIVTIEEYGGGRYLSLEKSGDVCIFWIQPLFEYSIRRERSNSRFTMIRIKPRGND